MVGYKPIMKPKYVISLNLHILLGNFSLDTAMSVIMNLYCCCRNDTWVPYPEWTPSNYLSHNHLIYLYFRNYCFTQKEILLLFHGMVNPMNSKICMWHMFLFLKYDSESNCIQHIQYKFSAYFWGFGGIWYFYIRSMGDRLS